jgi:hypothetical protein
VYYLLDLDTVFVPPPLQVGGKLAKEKLAEIRASNVTVTNRLIIADGTTN